MKGIGHNVALREYKMNIILCYSCKSKQSLPQVMQKTYKELMIEESL